MATARRHVAQLAIVAFFLVSASSAFGGALYFDASGAATWDNNITQNWGTASSGPYTAAKWTDGSAATFEGTGGNVSVDGTVRPGSMDFTVDGYHLSGGTIEIGNSATLAINVNEGSATIGSAFDSAGGTVHVQKGTLNFTGDTSVSSALKVTSGATAVLNKSAANLFTGDVHLGRSPAGAEARVHLGAADQIADTAVVRFYSHNDASRPMIVSMNGHDDTVAGINGSGYRYHFRLQNDAATDSTLTLDVPSGTTYGTTRRGGGGNYTSHMRLQDGATGKLNLVKDGEGTQYFGMTASGRMHTQLTYTGTTTVNDGVLSLRAIEGFDSSPTTLNGGTLEFYVPNWSATRSVNAPIAGSAAGTVAVNGNAGAQGRISFGGANKTYQGDTTIGADATVLLGEADSFSPNSRHMVDSGGTLDINGHSGTIGSLAGSGNLVLTGASAVLSVGGDDTTDADFAGSITGPGTLKKIGSGTQSLSGDSTYSGGTVVDGGTLLAMNASGSATGSGPVEVGSDGVLSGSGIVGGSVALAGGIAPGASVGTLTTGDETWTSGSSFALEIDDALGSPGVAPGWDLLEIDGQLDLQGLEAETFEVDLFSLEPGGGTTPGEAANFSAEPGSMHEWEFVHASDGIIGFEPEDFVVDASGFLNSIANVYGVGEFSVVAPSNNSLAIQFTSAVPEPSGLVLAALALLGVALGGRRRKRSVTPGVAS